jgi:hypothetical protein
VSQTDFNTEQPSFESNSQFDNQPLDNQPQSEITPDTQPIQPQQNEITPDTQATISPPQPEVVQETQEQQEQKDPAELQQQITELNNRLELQNSELDALKRELDALKELTGEGLIYIAHVLRSSDRNRIENAVGNLGSSIKNKKVE